MKFCQKCGNQMTDEAMLCEKCGFSFEDNAATDTPSVQATLPETAVTKPETGVKTALKSKKPLIIILSVVLAIIIAFVGTVLILSAKKLDKDFDFEDFEEMSKLSVWFEYGMPDGFGDLFEDKSSFWSNDGHNIELFGQEVDRVMIVFGETTEYFFSIDSEHSYEVAEKLIDECEFEKSYIENYYTATYNDDVYITISINEDDSTLITFEPK